ncbi:MULTISPECIES: acetyltransferase [unclassified Clostridium]|uniref:acetyltransferase n=1 Tax=unclassified Clostridium TaxID=2614128 RepID=UPI000298539B|nr:MULTISPECIES: acetyltransferase [unclassified Clostridium]EKQ51119.1 MAG: sugar O-acyltransferase, sialic acid O-acetyltransferase NeuD family [Clostridium sp. Maddingley MBC34-26]
MKKIVLIGAGGHCKVIIDIIKSNNEYEIIGITDSKAKGSIFGIPILGKDDILNNIHNQGIDYAFIAFGAINNIAVRNDIYSNLKRIGYKIPVLTHKMSIVSPYSQIEEGTCVMPGAIINPGVEIGKNCIINTGSIIEHDCKVGYNTHISPNVSIAGGVKIGFNTHIGIGASIIQGINIGNNATVGAGAVVISDIQDFSLALGVPARVNR